MTLVAVIDYGMGNLDSVRRSVEVAGATALVTSRPEDLASADRIILPGVGAFGVAMENLHRLDLIDELTTQVFDHGVPFLGICLGMQLMAASGTEHGTHRGLGWIPGTVERLVPTDSDPRVPHVGWNEVHPAPASSDAVHPVLAGLESDRDFYFVHSFHVVCDDADHALATTPYGNGFTSVVGTANAIGVQFHPEKSQQVGRLLLSNFVSWNDGSR